MKLFVIDWIRELIAIRKHRREVTAESKTTLPTHEQESVTQYSKCDRCGKDMSSESVYAGFLAGGKTWDCLCYACLAALFAEEDGQKEGKE